MNEPAFTARLLKGDSSGDTPVMAQHEGVTFRAA